MDISYNNLEFTVPEAEKILQLLRAVNLHILRNFKRRNILIITYAEISSSNVNSNLQFIDIPCSANCLHYKI